MWMLEMYRSISKVKRWTLTGNLANEAMDMFKKLITGKMPMVPQGSSVMSDVGDIATIEVLALGIIK